MKYTIGSVLIVLVLATTMVIAPAVTVRFLLNLTE